MAGQSILCWVVIDVVIGGVCITNRNVVRQIGVRSHPTTMSSPLLVPFSRALLNDIEKNETPRSERPFLGMARRYEAKKSKWDRPARLVLQALIFHAPDPEHMAREFLQALRKGENAAILSHCQWHYICRRYDQLIDTWS